MSTSLLLGDCNVEEFFHSIVLPPFVGFYVEIYPRVLRVPERDYATCVWQASWSEAPARISMQSIPYRDIKAVVRGHEDFAKGKPTTINEEYIEPWPGLGDLPNSVDTGRIQVGDGKLLARGPEIPS